MGCPTFHLCVCSGRSSVQAGERKGRRKGLGGLSPEKKKLLKQLIMQKAAEDMKAQQEREAEEKKKIIAQRIPKLDLDGLSDDQLQAQVKKLHHYVSQLEEEKYDWEVKLRKQDCLTTCLWQVL